MKSILKHIIATQALHFIMAFVLFLSNDHTFWWNYGFASPGIIVGAFIYCFVKFLVRVFKK